MTIPDFQSLMLPALRFAGDGKEHSQGDLKEAMAHQFNLTDAERNELLPSGAGRPGLLTGWPGLLFT
jgi:restriction system protein